MRTDVSTKPAVAGVPPQSGNSPTVVVRSHAKLRTRLLLLAGAAFVLLAGFTLAHTARYESSQPSVAPAEHVAISDGAAERLAGSLRIRTVSAEDPVAFDAEAFRTLHSYLQSAFPRVHAELRRETVGTRSLLYMWQGSDISLKPILLAGHLDVVPVEQGTENRWQQPPFSGRIADGFIWGRGAIDNKSAVVGMLEAIEMLLSEGFQPARTVYLAYGHDEEIGGMSGAREIAALLERRGVGLEMVLDEGGVIAEGILPAVSKPVALVGIAEKGFVTLELSTHLPGGHSSLPPRQSAVGILSSAIAKLEKNQMATRLEAPTRELLARIGTELLSIQRAVFANLWLTGPLVMRKLEESTTTNALLRTTTAVTIFQAGTKDNVLPSEAKAVVNFRILPADSISTVIEHVRRTVDDNRVKIKMVGRFSAEPSRVSSTDSKGFRTLERTIRSVLPDTLVAPYLVVVATDARHYSGLSEDIFRFLPLRLTSQDLARMHGMNERISICEYETAIRIYRQLVIEAAGS